MNTSDRIDFSLVANRLAFARKNSGLSYDQLAEKTGLAKSTLQRYEKGSIRNLPIDVVPTLASALEVSQSFLLGLDYAIADNWTAPLVQAYKDKDPSTQTAACAVLGIPRVIPPTEKFVKFEKPQTEEHEVLEIAAHNDDGDDDALNAALPDILKALDEQERKENVRNERLRKNNK